MSVTQPGPEDRTDVPPDVLEDTDADSDEARRDVERDAEQRLPAGGDDLPPGPADIAEGGTDR